MRKGTDENLAAFAKRIETRIKAGTNGSDSMELLICRLLTSDKNPQVSAALAMRWVEWRYGKPESQKPSDASIVINFNNFVNRPNGNSDRDVSALSETKRIPQLPS